MKKFTCISIITIFILSISACSKTDKFGVILWDPSDEANNGAICSILRISYLDEAAIVKLEENEVQIPIHLIEFFKKKKEAVAFAQEYSEIKNSYATTTRSNHALRALPDASSERVGSILRDEIAKIIWISPEKEKISSYEEHWYRIVMKDKRKGYTYGSFITVLNNSSLNAVEKSTDHLAKIFEIVTTKLYPENFLLLLEEDIFEIKSQYQKFYLDIDRERQVLIVKSEKYDKEINFEAITQTSNENFFKYDNGTSSIMVEEDKVTFEFFDSNSKETLVFIKIEDIEERLLQEFEKFEMLFENILNNEEDRQSSVYGNLTFYKDKTFKWENNHRLIPQIISTSSESGKISFEKTISKKFREKYDGILTFTFDSNEVVHFLIKVDEDGTLRLENTEAGNFTKNLLTKLNSKPINIVMRTKRQ
ncbi:MAG: hypothetical protein JXR63_01190 [Spirochaetales bacterium]|nr:hypothetical protein [Spirochaetales bacterium]